MTASPAVEVLPGSPTPLGAHWDGTGTNFALWSAGAHAVDLCLLDPDRAEHRHPLTESTHQVWHGRVTGIGPGQRYGYRVHGSYDPATGHRYNPAKLLLDPYARAVTGGVDYSGPILDHATESDYVPDHADSFAAVPLSVVVPDSPPPTPIARPVPTSESVIYELHVKGFTRLHPAVPEHLSGKNAGLAQPAEGQHLVA